MDFIIICQVLLIVLMLVLIGIIFIEHRKTHRLIVNLETRLWEKGVANLMDFAADKLRREIEKSFLYVGHSEDRISIIGQMMRPFEEDWGRPAPKRICLPESGFSLPGYYGYFSMWFEELEMLSRYVNRGTSYLEVGSLTGVSASYLARNNPALRITCVDAFTGGHATQGGNKEIFERNRSLVPDGENRITLLEGKSQEILPSLPAESFDCILVDADHGYEAVRQDAANAWRLVKPSGYILFHDYSFVPDVTRAVDEFCEEKSLSILEQQSGLVAVQTPAGRIA